MKHKRMKLLGIALTFLLVLNLVPTAFAAVASLGEVDPSEIELWMIAGETMEEEKTVTVYLPEEVDIAFAFDLTGSMSYIIDTAKDNAGDLMDEMDGWGGPLGVDFDYGVISYMDYVGSYASCGYSAWYGSGGDYPYRLDQAITSSNALVESAINGLLLGNGNDGPQDYSRIFYESYADPAISWRPMADKILLNFGDNVPHDCDLNEGVPGTVGGWSTGGDPGRDTFMFTGDDLDLQTVLADMAAEEIKLLESHSTTYANNYWEYWTGITGGEVFITTGGSAWLDDVSIAIKKSIAWVDDLHFEVRADYSGYASWLVDTDYYSGWVEDPVEMMIELGVPSCTPSGDHYFVLIAVDGDGMVYGEQEVLIHVEPTPVEIDIKPGSYPNSINLNNKGVIPVAILGSEVFDVSMVEVESVVFACAEPAPMDPEYYDVNGDGFMDLVLHFYTQDACIEPGDTEAYLTGSTHCCYDFIACDSVRTIPKK